MQAHTEVVSYLYREHLCRPFKVGIADVGQLVKQGATI